jgi:hypothetical protein
MGLELGFEKIKKFWKWIMVTVAQQYKLTYATKWFS